MTERAFVWLTNGITSKQATEARKADWQDMHTSFKANFQLSSAYEILFTLTYTEQYKDAFNLAKEKRYVWYNGQNYLIQQIESKNDEHGLATLQVTATHRLIDAMKDILIVTKETLSRVLLLSKPLFSKHTRSMNVWIISLIPMIGTSVINFMAISHKQQLTVVAHCMSG